MSFFFNDTATTEIYTLSLHDALPISMRLGVDPRKADQMVRGTVSLPHGTGKTARVVVFATGDKAAEAEAAGADVVRSEEHTSELQSRQYLVCRLLLEKKKIINSLIPE